MRVAIHFMLAFIVLSLSAVVFAHGDEIHHLVQSTVEIYKGIGIQVNGNSVADEGFIYNDRTYLPVRAVAEALGAMVEYDSESKTVSVTALRARPMDDPSAQAETALKLADIRKHTARYLDIARAQADGFKQSSGMVPNHGYHYINTLNILGRIDLDKPAGLVYIESGGDWHLVALEYTALFRPSQPLLPGGEWAKHEAACHYADGNELLESNIFACPRSHPRTESGYVTWHPSSWTFHVWAWHPNPLGLFAAENPLLVPYNVPGVEVEHHHR